MLSGQIPYTPDGQLVSEEFEAQVAQVFANLRACLAAVDYGFKVEVEAWARVPR